MCTVLVRKGIRYLLVLCEELQMSKAEYTICLFDMHIDTSVQLLLVFCLFWSFQQVLFNITILVLSVQLSCFINFTGSSCS